MINMKNSYEKKIDALEGGLEHVNQKLEKVLEVSKHAMCNEAEGLCLLNKKARKWLGDNFGRKDMVVGVSAQQKTTSETRPSARSHNKTKLNAKAVIHVEEVVEVMNVHYKIIDSDLEAVDILKNL